MASADIQVDTENDSTMMLKCAKECDTDVSEPSHTEVNSCHVVNEETISDENAVSKDVELQPDLNPDNLQEKCAEQPTNSDTSNNIPELDKDRVNGIKSESVETEEQSSGHVLRVNAEEWVLSSESEGLDKRLNANVPYMYSGKQGTYQPWLPKPYGSRGLSKRNYSMADSPNMCQTSPGSAINSNCHGSGKGEHVVLLHVNPGVAINFYMNDHTQHIQGPATVPMVSCNSTPPMPVPVQVPPGHMVQQLADENWTLREIILSPQPPVAMPVGGPYSPGSSFGSTSTGGPGGTLPYYVYPHLSYPPPMSYHPHMQPGLSNTMHGAHIPVSHSNGQGANGQAQYTPVSPPASVHKDERTQKQYYKLKKRLEARQKDNHSSRMESSDLRNDTSSGTVTVATEFDTSKQFKGADQSKIYEFLSTVTAPNVSEITARSALATWSPLSFAEDGSDKIDGVKTENILYNILISDKGPESAKKIAYCGKSTECELKDLKPGCSYYITLQARFDDFYGKSSEYTMFKTLSCIPDPPQPPKLISRAKTNLSLKWNAAVDNGSKILSYILEWDEGSGAMDFKEIFSGLQKQYKAVKLKVSTCYRFRLAATNSHGTSDFSDIVCFSTSGTAPTQPSPPNLVKSTSNSLCLSWEIRPNDDRFTLQMEEENSLHGFLAVYDGKETSYTCGKLRRNSKYTFRLCAHNEEGPSSWSTSAAFYTLPEKPSSPGKPTAKGRISSNSFKVSWDPPKDNGGSEIMGYSLKMDCGDGFEVVYTGPEQEFSCENLQPGQTYHFQVQCWSSGGHSLFSDISSIKTLPVAPGKCHTPRLMSKPKPTTLQIKWDNPEYNGGSDVLAFEVEVLNPDTTRRQVYKGAGTDCYVAGLLPGRQYSFFLRAYNQVGPGPYSDAFEATTSAGPPDVPKDVQAVPRSPHSIYVSWSEPYHNGSPITEYRVTSSHSENFLSVFKGFGIEVKNLIPATLYVFKVQALNAVGAGPFGDFVKCQTPPSSPGSISSACVRVVSSATSLDLAWKEPNDHGAPITSYNVEIGDTTLITVDTPQLLVDGLSPDTTYRVRIQAVNSIGLGPFTSLKATTRGLPPNPPFLECLGCNHNSLKLKWGDGKNPEFIQYTLELLNVHCGSFVPVYQGTSHCHKVSRLEECTSYSFRIYASNSEGDGPYSDTYTFTTLKAVPAPPKPPKVIMITETSCTIEWSTTKSIGDDMVSYKLQLGSKSSDYTVAYTGIQTSFFLTGLRPGTEYSVRVAAVRHCSDGSGELSSPFSSCTAFCTNSQVSKHPPTKPTSMISTWTEREPLSDQQWAIIILCGFTLFAISVAILTHWVISYANS